MILFDMRCAGGHDFEAWFKDSALMAPAVASRPKVDPERAAAAMKAWRKIQNHIEKNFDHVGPRFAEEARRMHHGEIDRRSIYGDATAEEARTLRDEGIEVGQIPWLPRQDG
jgi:hypothetical protein